MEFLDFPVGFDEMGKSFDDDDDSDSLSMQLIIQVNW